MSKRKRARYAGSVRFYKHLLIVCIVAAIVIPTGFCVFLTVSNRALHRTVRDLEAQVTELQQSAQITTASISASDSSSTVSENAAKSMEEEEKLSISTDDWNLFLVNEQNFLPSDFTVELETLPNTGKKQVDARIVEPLTEMLDAMEEEGLRPVVCSAYRTIEYQTELFENYIDKRLAEGWTYEDAFYKARTRIAIPGASEHHTGLAVDIVSKTHQQLDDAQADTEEAIWLAEHCAEYGFILRYPEGKEDITGIEYESWHFRYVGEEAASYIMENEITLEEYLALAE